MSVVTFSEYVQPKWSWGLGVNIFLLKRWLGGAISQKDMLVPTIGVYAQCLGA